MAKPFRWNIAKQEQLGALATPGLGDAYTGFVDDLRELCAGVLGASLDSQLVFVGRSPESCFDYLSGILSQSSWRDRLSILNISNRDYSSRALQNKYPDAIYPLKQHFEQLGLSPQALIHAPRKVTFVDLVYEGGTYDALYDFLHTWATQSTDDVDAVRRKLRFVGITSRRKSSPNTFRWQQHSPWTKTLGKAGVQNISVSRRLWDYMGNRQNKTSQWNPPWRWGDAAMRQPPRTQERLDALSLALYLREQGTQRQERLALRALMGEQHAVQHSWFRALISELG